MIEDYLCTSDTHGVVGKHVYGLIKIDYCSNETKEKSPWLEEFKVMGRNGCGLAG